MADDAAQRAWVERVLGVALPPAAGPGGSKTEFARLRLSWDSARKHLAGQLRTLKAAIVEQSADEEDAADIKANAGEVEDALAHFDDDLSDVLDDLYNAGGADAGLQRKARTIASKYRAFVEADPLMQDLDGNPFVPLDARKTLDGALGSIIASL